MIWDGKDENKDGNYISFQLSHSMITNTTNLSILKEYTDEVLNNIFLKDKKHTNIKYLNLRIKFGLELEKILKSPYTCISPKETDKLVKKGFLPMYSSDCEKLKKIIRDYRSNIK